jgi:hypothetical protein
LKLGLDRFQSGKPGIRHLFGECHAARRRRKIRQRSLIGRCS